MKSCRIWSLHRNPNSPKNPKKCQDFWFMSTIKLTFLSNYRFDFVPWNHSLKPHTRSGGIGWKYFTLNLALHQNPDNPRFAKVSMNIDNSIFKLNFLRNYRPDFFYWSLKRPLYPWSGGFSLKVFYFQTCIVILKVRKISKVLSVSTLELMFVRDYSFDSFVCRFKVKAVHL